MTTLTNRVTKLALLAALLLVTFGAPAQAQRLRGEFGFRVAPRFDWGVGIGVGPVVNPYWGPYYPYDVYPYVIEHPTSHVRVEGVPSQADVFIDGYFAGTAGTFGTTPGGHMITVFLPGYQTVTQNIYVEAGSTYKLRETMRRLHAGETSAPPVQAGTPSHR